MIAQRQPLHRQESPQRPTKGPSKDLDSYLQSHSDSMTSYNFKQVDKLDKSKVKKRAERSESSGARLKDLCPEDKAKIGELVKKLADEKKQKEEISSKFESERRELEERLRALEDQKSKFDGERSKMQDKFSQSLQMLQDLKKTQEILEQDRHKSSAEVEFLKKELEKREELDRIAQRELREKSRSPPPGRSKSPRTNQSSSQHHQSSVQSETTLKEIGELKNEIIKLTQSLQSVRISPQREQRGSTTGGQQDTLKRHIVYDDAAEERSHTRSRSKSPEYILQNLNEKSRDASPREDMRVEELHSLQEDLARKLEMTNSLINSKIQASAKKPTVLSSQKKKPIDQSKMSKLLEKAQSEFDEFYSNQPTPEKDTPQPRSQRDDLMAKKMQMFNEIKSRFEPEDKQAQKPRENSNGSSYYKQLIKQQTDLLHQQKEGLLRPPQPQPQPQYDSDEDLAYVLNNSSAVGTNNNTIINKTAIPTPHINVTQYDDSLFNIIDEMENENPVPQKQQQPPSLQSSVMRQQPKSFFNQPLSSERNFQEQSFRNTMGRNEILNTTNQSNRWDNQETSRFDKPQSDRQHDNLMTSASQGFFQQSMKPIDHSSLIGRHNQMMKERESYHQPPPVYRAPPQPTYDSFRAETPQQENINNNSSYRSNPYYLKAKREAERSGSHNKQKLSSLIEGARKDFNSNMASDFAQLNFNYDDAEQQPTRLQPMTLPSYQSNQ